MQEVSAGRVSGEAAKSLRSCTQAPRHHPWYGQSHMTHSCRIKFLFHSKGQCKSLQGPLPLPGRKLLCSSHFACPGKGCTDPPNGDSVPGNWWGPLPSAGAPSAAGVQAGGATHAPLPRKTQRNQAPHRVFLQFQQVSGRGEADAASCTSAVQPGQALPPMLLAESPNEQPEAASTLL